MKKKSPAKLKKELWKWFSLYIRTRDKGICFICSRRASGSGYHAAHFIPKSVGGILLYFHETNVNGCCYNCNINLGGNLYEYGMKLGAKNVKMLYALKGRITKDYPFEERIAYYKDKLATLSTINY